MLPLLLTTFFLSLFVTISLVPIFTKLAFKFQLVDIPDKRKVHTKPVPRVGGVAIAIGFFAVCLAFMAKDNFTTALLSGAGIIVIPALADDFFTLGYRIKFAGQIAAALVVIFYGGVNIVDFGSLLPGSLSLPGWASIILTLVVIVGITNAINLSDGLDGLAAGISFLVFTTIAYLSYRVGMMEVMLPAIAMAGATFGFLRFNTYPASIFMGDGGSQLLGFTGIVLAIKLTQTSMALSPVLPLLLFGLPILDTLTVMTQRVIDGRSPFHPDKNHIHHKLMRLGLFHTEAVFTIYVIQSVLVVSALFFCFFFCFIWDWLIILGYLVFALTILFTFTITEKRGYKLKRSFLDRRLKARLKILKRRGRIIRFFFTALKLGLLFILFFSVLLPAQITPFFTSIAGILIAILTISLVYKKLPEEFAARLALYLSVPYLIYLSTTTGTVNWTTVDFSVIYDLAFLFLAFFAIMVLRFTRRKKGFEFSTMDFLILVVVFVLLVIPDAQVQDQHLGLLASKVMIIFFSFEILVGEFREKMTGFTIAALLLFSVVVLRGLAMLTT